MNKENKEEVNLSVADQSGIDVIRKLTGEYGSNDTNNRLPFIKFASKEGKFKKKDGDAEVEIGETITGIIFKVTKRVQSKMGESPSYYSPEFESLDSVSLFDAETKEEVETSDYNTIKEKYGVKLGNVLYMYVVELGEYVRMQVSGGSLGDWWKYLGSFGAKDTILRYTTIIGCQPASSKIGKQTINYNTLTFKKDGEVDKEFLQDILNHLSQANIQLNAGTEKKLELVDTGEDIEVEA